MDRREVMQALAALATTAWEADGFDPDAIEDWEPIRAAEYATGSFSPRFIRAEGEGVIGAWTVGIDGFEDCTLNVWYDSQGVVVDLDGRGDRTRTSAMAMLDAEVATDLAVALYRAAEELKRRPGEDGE